MHVVLLDDGVGDALVGVDTVPVCAVRLAHRVEGLVLLDGHRIGVIELDRARTGPVGDVVLDQAGFDVGHV